MNTREHLLVLAVTGVVVMLALVGLVTRPDTKQSATGFPSPAGMVVLGR